MKKFLVIYLINFVIIHCYLFLSHQAFAEEVNFLKAVTDNNINEVHKQLLIDDMDPNYSEESITALSAAVNLGYIKIARLLLNYNADPNLVIHKGLTPLMIAVENNNMNMAQLLLYRGADPNGHGGSNMTPLTLAVNNNYLEMVQILLENYADPRMSIPDGSLTPFDIAHKHHYQKIIQALHNASNYNPSLNSQLTEIIEQGDQALVKKFIDLHRTELDLNAPNLLGETPLMIAARNGLLQIGNLLVTYGADPNARNAKNETALMEATNADHFAFVAYLISQGVHLNVKERVHGTTALIIAVIGGHLQIVQHLLIAGAKFTIADHYDTTPLMHAELQTLLGKKSFKKSYEQIYHLLSDVIKKEVTDVTLKMHFPLGLPMLPQQTKRKDQILTDQSQKPYTTNNLIDAIHNKDIPTIQKHLFEDMPKNIINGQDTYGETPVWVATSQNSLEIVRALISLKVDLNIPDQHGVTPLMVAIALGYIQIAHLLLAHGADPNKGDKQGRTPLREAVRQGFTDTSRLLLRKGALLSLEPKGENTLLMMAAIRGHLKIATMLLDAGAKINDQNRHGNTALMLATFFSDPKVVKLLLSRGADPNTPDHYGTTPLMWAARYGSLEVAQLLIEAGVDKKIKDKNGRIALYWAIQNKHTQLIELLEDESYCHDALVVY